jgi:hypothetical protein
MSTDVGFVVAAVVIIDAVLVTIAARRRHLARIDEDES